MALIACDQVSKLKPKHVKSYFASVRGTVVNGAPMLPLIQFASANVLKFVEVPALREAIGADPFIKYHTTYSATGNLCLMMCESLEELRHHMISDATYQAVIGSAANYWDPGAKAQIINKMRAMTYVWLKVNDRELDDWYQGRDAMTKVSTYEVAQWMAIFRKMKELSSNVTAITNAADINQLLAALPENAIV